MINIFNKNKTEILHTTRLIHKKTNHCGIGNQSYEGHYFIVKINEEILALDTTSSSEFNN